MMSNRSNEVLKGILEKIELPNGSDGMRALPPFKDGVSLWGKVTNRNKRGITLDIRTPEGL